MNKIRVLVLALAAGGILSAALPAEARLGSTGSSRTSSVSVTPTRSPTSSLLSFSNSARAGSGRSVGVSRTDVMAQARSQSVTQSPARYYGSVDSSTTAARVGGVQSGSYQARNAYDNRGYNQPAQKGYTGAQMLAAGVGGAVVGGLATHALEGNRPAYVQGAPGYNNGGQYQGAAQYGAGGQYASPAPAQAVYAAPQASSGSGFLTFLTTLLVLGGIGAVAYFLIKRMNQGTSSATAYEPAFNTRPSVSTDPEAERDLAVARELLQMAPDFYRSVQDANNRGDKVALERMTDNQELLQVLTSDIDTRTEPARTRVLRVDVTGNQVLGFLRDGANYMGSIHYSATVAEGESSPEQVLEVYHFVRGVNGGTWRLAGIEQT
ncbi:hypothetical protein [Burkholderia cenocepacia]|uniref:hypothetical protein n=1 Tax=Burkholderia cenocepacia TaxID=95486 RepID=UPI00076DCF1D|nr:hypothetical protein [Burkholderia cenocepacia]KWU17936.1 hypothetical protein AS149_14780 [Burkholderia cenocepacia]